MSDRNESRSILIIDDDPGILKSFSAFFADQGYSVFEAADGRQGLEAVDRHRPDVVMTDLVMPRMDGLEFLRTMKANHPGTPVIVISGTGNVSDAIGAMKLGAWDYLAKPVMDLDEVGIVAQRAIEARDLRLEVDSLRQSLLAGRPSHPEPFAPIVTNDPKLIRIFQYVEAISRTAQPVLIAGRTGTGKELVARAVHDASRRKGAFVAVNAAGLDDQVFSDTLFGHLRGSFTGADQPREGMIARAAGGTLFLDEIGNLGELSQIKLLRLLQEGEYYPLGSDLPRTATARIVAATNRDLQAEVEAGKFRQDLYYRLCTHRVALPPLSERKGDLPLLLSTFVAEAADALGVPPPPVPPELPGYLAAYDFPGNVRELKAMVHDAVARCGGGPLGRESFLVAMGRGIADDGGRPEGASPGAVRAEEDHFPTLREAEESLIRKALALAGGNQGIAARYLGITRQGLNKKLNKDRRAGETG